ncbi:MAG: hypothetical protein U0573_05715 [Phycisphaerales bacterium]|nr:DUF883 family protein [Planctomycetota bacterium]
MSRTLKRNAVDDGLSESIEKLGEDVGRIKEDLNETAHDVAAVASEGVAMAKRGVATSVRTARQQGERAAESLAEQIAERPWTSVAIAAGAGLLVGLIMSRRD